MVSNQNRFERRGFTSNSPSSTSIANYGNSAMSRENFLKGLGLGAGAIAAAGLGLGLSGAVKAQSISGGGAAKKYLVSVTQNFQPSNMASIGGTCEWHWPEAGIAIARSSSSTFVDDAEGGMVNENIEYAVPSIPFEGRENQPLNGTPDLSNAIISSSSIPSTPNTYPSYYEFNGQWALQAVGATRPDNTATGPLSSPFLGQIGVQYATPVWQLDPGADGSGVSIAILDSGMPAQWNSYDIPEWVPAQQRWLCDFWTKNDVQLHPEFDWYHSGNAGDGGIVPIFKSASERDTYFSMHGQSEGMDLNAVIIDPDLGGFDGRDHSTAVNSVIAARHKDIFGAMHGLAPKAKIFNFRVALDQYLPSPPFPPGFITGTPANDPIRVLKGLYMALAYQCQVVNICFNIFLKPNEIVTGVSGVSEDTIQTVYAPRIVQLLRKALNVLHRKNVLVLVAGGNYSTNIDEYWKGSYVNALMDLQNVMLVSGTAPRDYLPFLYDPGNPYVNLSIYTPTPGTQKPYDSYGRAFNLDRSMFIRVPQPSGPGFFGTDYGSGIEIAGPGGSFAYEPYESDRQNDPTNNPLLQLYNLMYTASPVWGGTVVHVANPDELPLYPNIDVSKYQFVMPFLPGFELRQGYHGFIMGTSFATPHVVAVAALAAQAYKSTHGTFPTIAKLKQILKKSADDMVGPATDRRWVYVGKEDPRWPGGKDVGPVYVGDTIPLGCINPNFNPANPIDSTNSPTLAPCIGWELIQDFPHEKPSKDKMYGWGRVNAKQAIEVAKS